MAEFSLIGLKLVREVARRGSFSAAAERLGYTQSAVSRQVAVMEAAAGRTLFERHARGVRPTDAGAVVARRADAVLAELEAARHELDELAVTPPARIRVGAYSTALAALVPRAIAAVEAQQRQARVMLSEGTSDRLLTRVAARRIDLAVVTPPRGGQEGVELESLLEDPLLVATSRGHRLAGRRSVAADELRHERWVVASRDLHSPMLGAWTESAWQPEIAYLARDWNAKLGLVASGLAVTVVPGLAIPLLPEPVAAIRIDHPAAERTTAIAVPVGHPGDPLRHRFQQALHDVAADLAAETTRRVRD